MLLSLPIISFKANLLLLLATLSQTPEPLPSLPADQIEYTQPFQAITPNYKNLYEILFSPEIIKYAEELKVAPALLSDTKLYSFIDEWIGTRYRYGGTGKNGIDCSGFSCKLYEEVFNINLSHSSRAIFTEVVPVQKEELKEGDLVFFKIRKNQISHVGVYLHNNYFVHASTQQGVIISSLNEPYYQKYFFKGGRIR